MGYSAGLDIDFSTKLSSIRNVITVLFEAGWTTVGGYRNKISFLPVGDNGIFDWHYADLEEWPEILAVIEQQEKTGELVGIVLVHGQTEANFLLHQAIQDFQLRSTVLGGIKLQGDATSQITAGIYKK